MAGILKRNVNPQAPKSVMDRIIVAAMKMLHTPQMTAQFIRMMKVVKDPATALAQATIFAMKTLYDQAKGIPPTAIMPAVQQILMMLGEIADAAKLFPVDKETLQRAFQMIVQRIQQQGQGSGPQRGAMGQPAMMGG